MRNAAMETVLEKQWHHLSAHEVSEVVNRLFQSAPIRLDAWLRIVAVGMGVYLTIGLEKWLCHIRVGKGAVAHQVHYPVANEG